MTVSAAPTATIWPSLTASASTARLSPVMGMIGPPRKMRSAPSVEAAKDRPASGAIEAAPAAAARNLRRLTPERILPSEPKILPTQP
jgi:hypothetical protein